MIRLYSKFEYQFKRFFLIALGAFPGALIRWQVNNDLIVNLLGTLILGFVIGSKLKLPFKLLIGVGFCGSLTTFSSWIINCLHLLMNGELLKATILIIFPLFAGLMAASIGFFIGERIKLVIF